MSPLLHVARITFVNGEAPRQWLLLIYRLPAEPSRMRTYIWRQLKALGSLYFQQAVWILPKTEHVAEEFGRIVAKVEEFGGEASLLTTVSPSQAWEERVVSGFNEARNEEYAEIAESEERFEDEIRRETRKEKFTFAELEEGEAEWERLKRWHERVRERDFFHAPGLKEAEARLGEGERLLEEFAQRVYERQGVEDNPKDKE